MLKQKINRRINTSWYPEVTAVSLKNAPSLRHNQANRNMRDLITLEAYEAAY